MMKDESLNAAPVIDMAVEREAVSQGGATGSLTLSAGLSVIIHSLALGLLLFAWPIQNMDTNALSEISVEIVAEAAPPEPDMSQEASVEQKVEEKPEEQKVEPQQEPPVTTASIDQMPAPPEPAPVVLPAPRPVPPTPRPAQSEVQKTKRKQESPPRQARDSNGNTEQRVARLTTAPPSYLGQVSAMLHRAKVYPPSARERGEQGRAVVRFTIVRSGNASGIVLVQSSGNRELDQAASSVIARAGPFPPLPEEYSLPALSVTVPIDYSLR